MRADAASRGRPFELTRPLGAPTLRGVVFLAWAADSLAGTVHLAATLVRGEATDGR